MKNLIYLINVNNGSYAQYTYPLIEEYAKKTNSDIAVFDTEIFKNSGWIHPNFLIFDIFKHFITTDYHRMMYVDMDIRILPQSPNIFEECNGFGMVEDHKADLWRRAAMNEWLQTHHPQLTCSHYFNGGVIVGDHPSINQLLGSIPEDIMEFWQTTKDKFPHGFNQNILNYCIMKSNLKYTVLSDKWNKVCRKATCDDYFIHYVANKTQIQTDYDKFKDNICNPNITMTLDTL
jgi:hypothetical protein